LFPNTVLYSILEMMHFLFFFNSYKFCWGQFLSSVWWWKGNHTLYHLCLVTFHPFWLHIVSLYNFPNSVRYEIKLVMNPRSILYNLWKKSLICFMLSQQESNQMRFNDPHRYDREMIESINHPYFGCKIFYVDAHKNCCCWLINVA